MISRCSMEVIITSSPAQSHDFDMTFHAVSNFCGGKQYKRYGYQFIPIKVGTTLIDKALIHVLIWGTTHYERDNIHIMIPLEHIWDPVSINDTLEVKVFHRKLWWFWWCIDKSDLWAIKSTTWLYSHILIWIYTECFHLFGIQLSCLKFRSHFKSQFPNQISQESLRGIKIISIFPHKVYMEALVQSSVLQQEFPIWIGLLHG